MINVGRKIVSLFSLAVPFHDISIVDFGDLQGYITLLASSRSFSSLLSSFPFLPFLLFFLKKRKGLTGFHGLRAIKIAPVKV